MLRVRITADVAVALILIALPLRAALGQVNQDALARDCRGISITLRKGAPMTLENLESGLRSHKLWLDGHRNEPLPEWKQSDESCQKANAKPEFLMLEWVTLVSEQESSRELTEAEKRAWVDAKDDEKKRAWTDATKGFRGACLWATNLSGLDLSGADLTGAMLYKSDLRNVNLEQAQLNDARLYKSDLTGADLPKASLNNAVLDCANLTRADLDGVKLEHAKLIRTLVEGVSLAGANLTDALYEATGVPLIRAIYDIKGLPTLHFKDTKVGLELLRNAFKNSDLRDQEREVTYAIRHTDRLNSSWWDQALLYVLFEGPAEWGNAPWRPLMLFVAGIGLFFGVYLLLIWFRLGEIRRVSAGQTSEVVAGGATSVPHEITTGSTKVGMNVWTETGQCSRWWYVFYFSVLSAFHIGFREIEIGRWLSRMQPREYHLRPSRWIRLASGTQSLLSVGLLALWLLAYFGRPFE